jgi:hypothetical protein
MNAEQEIRFALADITGKGFAGDFGFKTAEELAEHSGGIVSPSEALEVLERLHTQGECLRDGDGFSGLPVQCVLCSDDPCSCPSRWQMH